jgi:hypothetical protein
MVPPDRAMSFVTRMPISFHSASNMTQVRYIVRHPIYRALES